MRRSSNATLRSGHHSSIAVGVTVYWRAHIEHCTDASSSKAASETRAVAVPGKRTGESAGRGTVSPTRTMAKPASKGAAMLPNPSIEDAYAYGAGMLQNVLGCSDGRFTADISPVPLAPSGRASRALIGAVVLRTAVRAPRSRRRGSALRTL